MKTLLALAAALTATALTAPLAPVGSSVAVDTVDLSRPGTLERGDDVRLPHLEGTTIVDGDRRIEVPHVMTLMGTSGDDYVVSTRRAQRPRYRVKRVTPEGDTAVLLRGKDALFTQLSSDGQLIIHTDNRRRTRLTAFDATDGSEVASGRFRGYAEVVDADGGTVLVSSWQRERTVAWDLATGTRERIVDRIAYHADLSADRLAVYTDDPYRGGCTVVSTVSDPDTTLWRSCRQRVVTFSPDGALLASTDILADGVGPGEVQLRETDGSRLTLYRANWFGAVQWEDDDTLLLDANGRRQGATVRCDGADCERASDLAASSP